ncbi:MAG: potassium transporter TrkG [Dermatophilaceae bacterium]
MSDVSGSGHLGKDPIPTPGAGAGAPFALPDVGVRYGMATTTRRGAGGSSVLPGSAAARVRMVPLAFLGVIAVGTCLLVVPWMHASGEPDLMAAAFTAVSAVCVTGLATVDTTTFWTPLGQVVILALIQVGGFGIMTFATLLSLLIRGRLEVSGQLRARAETHAFDKGRVTHLIGRIAVRVLIIESVIAAVLTLRFAIAYHEPLGTAVWHGVFHAVSAFNNAGFALFSGNLVPFVGDPWIVVPICVAIVAGGLGFPVYFELAQHWRRPRRWSAHTHLTVVGTSMLLAGGLLSYLLFEWSNPKTMGGMSVWDKVLAAGTASVVARTAGFNTIDYGAITGATLVITLLLMFIGGGSGGTAGGVKVTTFFLLWKVIVSEARGETDVVVGRRRISSATVRQALSVALLGVGTVTIGTIGLVVMTGLPLDAVTFEAISAFGTVGLSTGITAHLSVPAQLLVMTIMFVGRVGTVTVASSLALHGRGRRYRYPEESPIVG